MLFEFQAQSDEAISSLLFTGLGSRTRTIDWLTVVRSEPSVGGD